MTPEQKATSALYQQLIASAVWQDLERMGDEQRNSSMKLQDATPAENLNLGKVCEERGFRRGIRWVFEQAKTKAQIG